MGALLALPMFFRPIVECMHKAAAATCTQPRRSRSLPSHLRAHMHPPSCTPGSASQSLKLAPGIMPQLHTLQLRGGPGMALIATNFNNTDAADAVYVTQTRLQFASAGLPGRTVVWITDTRSSPPAPVAGAVVSLYAYSEYEMRERNGSVRVLG